MLVDSFLSFINKSILVAGMPAGLFLQLLISSLKRNPKRGLVVTHPKIGGLGMESMFNKNVIKPRDDEEYIKKVTDTMAMLCAKQECDCKDDMLVHLKASLN